MIAAVIPKNKIYDLKGSGDRIKDMNKILYVTKMK